MMKKTMGIFAAVLFAFVMFAGPALAAEAKFGVAVPLTGPYAAQAQDMKNGSMLALEEINAGGGVLGGPAKLIVRDSELKGSVALRRFKEMVAEENLKVIGGNLSGSISLVANEYACKNGLVYMSYCHTSLPVGKEFCGNGFTGAVIPYQTGAALASFAFKNLGKTFMTLTADYRWGHDNLASWIYNSRKYGGEFLGNIYAPLGTRDISAYIPRIMAKNPDFLVLSNYGTDQTTAVKQLAELGLTKKMKIVISKTHLISIKECGPAYDENVYGAVTYYWKMQDKYPQSKPFVKAFWDKYGAPPSADGECAYVATKAIFQAMQKAGTVDDVPKIISVLEEMELNTPKGMNRFRPCDHVREQSIVILRGKGARASGWDVADIVTEIPPSQTLESCYNNRMDIPYGTIKLPGK
jgi:branched-chain amino acid transport system substrate-binding protein